MKQKDKDRILKLIREHAQIEVNDYIEKVNWFHCDVVSTAKHIAKIVYRNNPFDKKHEVFVYRITTETLIHFFKIHEDKDVYYLQKNWDNCYIKELHINKLRKPIYVNMLK